jgi:pimeloyl-ACP methyl ester carboxylesterase
MRVNGAELDVVDEGTGVPVVFSHGGSSDLRYWEPQRRAFAARYRFVAYSRRYHGTGRWPSEGETRATADVEDLVEIVRRLDAGPGHLVGFSTAVALRTALAAPDLIRSLTIVEPNVPWLLEGDPEGEAALAWWRQENERVRAEAGHDEERRAALWFELVNNRGPGTFAAQPQPYRQMWLDNFGAQRPSDPPEPLLCERLRSLRVPTLAVGGEHGMPYSRRILDVLAGCIPDCRLAILPGVTHFMSYQAPEQFNQLVLAFLDTRVAHRSM